MKCLKHCCITLKTGSIILAHFFLMMYTAIIVGSIYAILQEQLFIDKYILITIMCVAFLMLIFTGLLLYGIYKKVPNLMLPWLIVKFLGVVIGSIVTVILCGSTIVAIFMNHNYKLLIMLFLGPIILCICWCIYYVIYSHYKQLTDENENKPKHTTSKDDLKISIIPK